MIVLYYSSRKSKAVTICEDVNISGVIEPQKKILYYLSRKRKVTSMCEDKTIRPQMWVLLMVFFSNGFHFVTTGWNLEIGRLM